MSTCIDCTLSVRVNIAEKLSPSTARAAPAAHKPSQRHRSREHRVENLHPAKVIHTNSACCRMHQLSRMMADTVAGPGAQALLHHKTRVACTPCAHADGFHYRLEPGGPARRQHARQRLETKHPVTAEALLANCHPAPFAARACIVEHQVRSRILEYLRQESAEHPAAQNGSFCSC